MFDVIPAAVYAGCFATSGLCAYLLTRSFRRTRARLLLWSAICFVLLAANNLVLFVDMLVLPDVDLRMGRLVLSLGAVVSLLVGCIWDLERQDQ